MMCFRSLSDRSLFRAGRPVCGDVSPSDPVLVDYSVPPYRVSYGNFGLHD